MLSKSQAFKLAVVLNKLADDKLLYLPIPVRRQGWGYILGWQVDEYTTESTGYGTHKWVISRSLPVMMK